MLDPFVPLLRDTLTSSPHAKVLSRTLHCLVWLTRLPLPSLPAHVEDIAGQLFALLQKYGRTGVGVAAAAGSSKELVLSAFKVRGHACVVYGKGSSHKHNFW